MFTIDDINKETARNLKIDIKLVTAVNTEQWKQVEYHIKHHSDYEIKMLSLCTFTPRYSVIKKKIRELIFLIRRERKLEQTDKVKNVIKSYTQLLSNVWKIKNTFAVNNIKTKNKKLNKQNGRTSI